MRELWTIGHSTRTITDFIALLKANKIATLADVRTYPGSRRCPQFNQDNLSQSLVATGIEYFHFPELGGRRKPRSDSPNTVWRHKAFRGYADYMITPAFHAGIDRLLAIAGKKRTAIMCAEALWWRCHRSLIADYLKASGYDVLHIMSPKSTEGHPFTSAARIVNGKLSYSAPESEVEFAFDRL